MSRRLLTLFRAISAPTVCDHAEHPVYSTLPLSDDLEYFVGKDQHGCACFLILPTDSSRIAASPIRLEYLEVQFQTMCRIQSPSQSIADAPMTVLRCRSLEEEVVDYFLIICDMLVRTVGCRPSCRSISVFVYRLAAIFQRIRSPGTRLVNGLFGELYVIASSNAPEVALECWRIDGSARFDFVDSDFHMDVKTTAGRLRRHVFSYEQCNPSTGSTGIIASMFIERVARGLTLGSLIHKIEQSLGGRTELVWKLHEVVADTLGASIGLAMSVHFDENVTRSSLRFFDVTKVPAIRGTVPSHVSGVKFEVDLSDTNPIVCSMATGIHHKLTQLWPR